MNMQKNIKYKAKIITSYVDQDSKKMIEFWILRTLLDLQGHRNFIDMNLNRLSEDDLATFLGLEKYIDYVSDEDVIKVKNYLRKKLSILEKKFPFTCSSILKNNIKKISKLVGLNKIEKDILTFSIYLHYYDLLDNAIRTLNSVTYEKTINILSVLLNYDTSEIKSALSPKSKLLQSGLISFNRYDSRSVTSKIDLLSDEFPEKMMNHEGDIEEVIKDSIRKCSPTQLKIKDFDHLKDDINLLLPYLQQGIEKNQIGINILLYGKPGTGKTELTKVISKALNVDIYEVSYADEDDEPISGVKRLKAYKVAQSILSQRKILLMFDEIEDIISDESNYSFMGKKKQNNKAWMNRMLETNVLPTVWITNDVYEIDSAMIRRFDMSIEIPIPPKSKRKEILINNYAGIIDDLSIDNISRHENIAPALVSRAAKVLNAISDKNIDKDKAVNNIINNTLKAQGYNEIKENKEEGLPSSYDLDFIHTNMNLKELTRGIKKHPNARICLYGVPGTGKSAFGKWIAEYTDKPFILKKGSDLISMWVGGTEKNIANAFNEAREEGAVLVFDEVDSFLQDRRSAKNTWEVTQVNEMLVQMENFNGIFLATTNLMSGLDQASLRRFDMKLEFGYLKPKNAWKLFQNECKTLGLDITQKDLCRKTIEKFNRLTPGDFAAVRRQNRFRPLKSAEMFLERLNEEILVKEKSIEKTMGFQV